jgi:hypothetical protein
MIKKRSGPMNNETDYVPALILPMSIDSLLF